MAIPHSFCRLTGYIGTPDTNPGRLGAVFSDSRMMAVSLPESA